MLINTTSKAWVRTKYRIMKYELKYIKPRGPAAHRARIETELLLTEQKIDDVLSYYRTMVIVGLARDLTAFLKPISR